jgi:predicted nicotinamide N-methyase
VVGVDRHAASEFVRLYTDRRRVPFVPELRMHCGEDDPHALWQRAEDTLGVQVSFPFWAYAWPGGLALARYVLDHRAVVQGRRVFDLAAGCGVSAIAASRAGARDVIANDVDPLSAVAIALNADANDVRVVVQLGDVLGTDCVDADLLLLGDVAYDERLAERTFAFLARVRASGMEVLVGDPGRNYFPRDLFVALASYDIAVPRVLEGVEVKHTSVWRMR